MSCHSLHRIILKWGLLIWCRVTLNTSTHKNVFTEWVIIYFIMCQLPVLFEESKTGSGTCPRSCLRRSHLLSVCQIGLSKTGHTHFARSATIVQSTGFQCLDQRLHWLFQLGFRKNAKNAVFQPCAHFLFLNQVWAWQDIRRHWSQHP